MMNTKSFTFFFILILSIVTASCSAPDYWIPPSAPSTQSSAGVMLSETIVSTQKTPADPVDDNHTTPSAAPNQTTPIAPTENPTSVIPNNHTPYPATPTAEGLNIAPILYYAQAADTLPVVSVRFGVQPSEITSPDPIPETDFIDPGQLLIIPRRLGNTTSAKHLIPDSDVVYSPSAIGFDIEAYINDAGGYLRTYEEWHKSTGKVTGAEVIQRVAIENAINPRLLLSLLEYHSGWVADVPETPDAKKYPLGFVNLKTSLYDQLVLAVNQLSIGYYGYREGRMTEINFKDGSTARLAPDLNAGTAALQYYFAQHYSGREWVEALDPESGFPALHEKMFGSPWIRAKTVEPLYPPGITQPPLTLPFARNWTWSYTGGPHGAWEHDGAYAALDFAPGSMEPGCVESKAWVVASADGLVVRTGPGLVVLDLDGDGYEQTGWVLVYLHVATEDRIPLDTWVAAGDKLGHPSCEGGFATGTHLHIARKYNGEWVPADGPLPFDLGGWIAHAGDKAYQGTLTRGDVTLIACTCSNYQTFIIRTDDDP
jgi:murein DD-endopeptidase MepM/ murein hydrolase activator NlpD